MTIESSVSKVIYEGNDSTIEFPFNFKVFKKSELGAFLTNKNVEPEETIDLFLDETNIELADSGGTLTYKFTNEQGQLVPLPKGYTIAIVRNMEFLQTLSIANEQPYSAELIEKQFDIATMERQQLREEMTRAIKVPATSATIPEELLQQLLQAEVNAKNSANSSAQSAQEAKEFVESGITDLETNKAQAIADIDNAVTSAEESINETKNTAISQVNTTTSQSIMTVELATQGAINAKNDAEQSAFNSAESADTAEYWANQASQAGKIATDVQYEAGADAVSATPKQVKSDINKINDELGKKIETIPDASYTEKGIAQFATNEEINKENPTEAELVALAKKIANARQIIELLNIKASTDLTNISVSAIESITRFSSPSERTISNIDLLSGTFTAPEDGYIQITIGFANAPVGSATRVKVFGTGGVGIIYDDNDTVNPLSFTNIANTRIPKGCVISATEMSNINVVLATFTYAKGVSGE